jgi:hypothetical protein
MPLYTVHRGLDYVALLAKGETTENPTATFRSTGMALKVADLLNAAAAKKKKPTKARKAKS